MTGVNISADESVVFSRMFSGTASRANTQASVSSALNCELFPSVRLFSSPTQSRVINMLLLSHSMTFQEHYVPPALSNSGYIWSVLHSYPCPAQSELNNK